MTTIFKYKCEYCKTRDLTAEQEYCHMCGVKLFPFEPNGMYKEMSSTDDSKKKNPETPEETKIQPQKEKEPVQEESPKQDQKGQLYLDLSSSNSSSRTKDFQVQTGKVNLGDIFLKKFKD